MTINLAKSTFSYKILCHWLFPSVLYPRFISLSLFPDRAPRANENVANVSKRAIPAGSNGEDNTQVSDSKKVAEDNVIVESSALTMKKQISVAEGVAFIAGTMIGRLPLPISSPCSIWSPLYALLQANRNLDILSTTYILACHMIWIITFLTQSFLQW